MRAFGRIVRTPSATLSSTSEPSAISVCAAKGLGMAHMDIVSGAGHDAIFIAELGPAGMIFVPCEGGISHNEIENATPEDLAAGCAVLLRAMVSAAQ